MSSAADGKVDDRVDVQHGDTEVFEALVPISTASGTQTWTLALVLRDKPDVATTLNVEVWSQTGGCTTASAVLAAQRYATGAMTLPAATDHGGVILSVPGSGAANHSFAGGETLCLALTATGGDGSEDVHLFVDTVSTSGAAVFSELAGPFSYAPAPFLLHNTRISGGSSPYDMSTSASGASGDRLNIKNGTVEVFEGLTPLVSASGQQPWTLLLVLRDSPSILFASATVAVWVESGCTSFSAVPAGQRLAQGTVSVPIAVQGEGVNLSLPGTGAASYTFQPGDRLCVSIANTSLLGVQDFHLLVDTTSTTGVAGKTGLSGPFSDIAAAREGGATAAHGDWYLNAMGLVMGLSGLALVLLAARRGRR